MATDTNMLPLLRQAGVGLWPGAAARWCAAQTHRGCSWCCCWSQRWDLSASSNGGCWINRRSRFHPVRHRHDSCCW
jgi:hypothetical protein